MAADLEQTLGQIVDEARPCLAEGKVADYIPALARVDRNKLGIAVVGVDGQVATAGDAHEAFSIQSISKVFTLTLALGKLGNDLWKRVGREPSGSSFNSIVQLEFEHGIPRNPFINAGAIVVSDVVLGERQPDAALAEILEFMRALACDDNVCIDREVADSEARTGSRNRGLAHFMRGFGNVRNEVEATLQCYFSQCALAMSCVQLARAGLFLAADGMDRVSNRRIVRADRAHRISALMLTCGHYDASGDFAYRVGLPGKSGVGGGILAIAPGHGAIAAWSPALSENGNSLAASLMLERLAQATGWSVFGASG